jgi:RNA polymerase sigma-B factor
MSVPALDPSLMDAPTAAVSAPATSVAAVSAVAVVADAVSSARAETRRIDSARVAVLFAQYAESGDRKLRNELVEMHRHVADFYVKRYARHGVDADDLRQVALLSIVRAVDRYDPARGVEFATFASRTVEGELKRYFRDRTWAVRPPRRAQELHLSLRRTEEDLEQRLGRSPTAAELAKDLGETVDHVLEAMEAGSAHHRTSLDQAVSGSDDSDAPTFSDRVLAHHETGFGQVDRQVIIHRLLDDLDERDRQIIQLRFFENRTQQDIALELGVSQSYLSRILRRVLLDLRTRVGEDLDFASV